MNPIRRSTRIRANLPTIAEISDLLEDYQEPFKHHTRSRSISSAQYMTIEDSDDDTVILSPSPKEYNEVVPRYNTRPRTTSSTIDSLDIVNKVLDIPETNIVNEKKSDDKDIDVIESSMLEPSSTRKTRSKFNKKAKKNKCKIKSLKLTIKEPESSVDPIPDNITVSTVNNEQRKSKRIRNKLSMESKNTVSPVDINKLSTNDKDDISTNDNNNFSAVDNSELSTDDNNKLITDDNNNLSTDDKNNLSTEEKNNLSTEDKNKLPTEDITPLNEKMDVVEANEVMVLRSKKRSYVSMNVNDLNSEREKEDLQVPIDKKALEDTPPFDPMIVQDEEGEVVEEYEDILGLIINDPNLSKIQLSKENLTVKREVLGEGQDGIVYLGNYNSLKVACKTRRKTVEKDLFYSKVYRELTFAYKFSNCKYINKYIGWVYCNKKDVESKSCKNNEKELYVIQQYVSNGDARSYLYQREYTFKPTEVLIASICLFSAITDAHRLDVGIVDLKLENYLIDFCGNGYLTDFGSCIDLLDRITVNLKEEEVSWTKAVAAPEMISKREFSKASDVFMGTLIIAELMTEELTDSEFKKNVLRRKNNGSVDFTPDIIKNEFQPFFKILSKGLQNDPLKRPTANEILLSLKELKSMNTPYVTDD